ncbi:7TM diverse intracellular signaling domain-containing protein [Oligoflexus tunisiensis]|uniref:7TM diverse intracellular signaling domain-containing protein n=1 Tax=Oligoflexus tunisiensis TaxID=708132 RepID=UPI000AD2AA0D|nr:7TM diverse intracellular signaling domain-containing protein [Oligoflexus tunisiensis]
MKRFSAIFFLLATLGFWGKAFSQEPVVIDDTFEFVRLDKGNLRYFYQDKTINWLPIDAIDYLKERNLEEKRRKNFAYYDALYQSVPFTQITAVLKPEIRDRFLKLEQPRPNFGLINRPVWYKVKLKYQGQQEKRKIIFNVKGYLFDAQYFLVDQDDRVLVSYRKSIQTPKVLKERADSGNNVAYAIELSSEKREVDLYFLIYTSVVPHQLDMEFHSEEHLDETLQSWLPFQWAYAGATLGLLIYNFGIFLISRQKVYLYYVFFVGTTLLLTSGINGFYFNFFTENTAVYWTHYLLLSLGIHGIFFVAFARKFLPFDRNQRLERITGIAQKMVIAAAVLYAIGSAQYMLLLGFAMICTIIPLIVGPAVWLIFKKEKQAILFMLAFSTYLFGSFLRTLMIQGALPSFPVLDYIMEIGSVTEALFLSIAMGDKLRTLNLSLEKYINKVEEIVEEKTRAIRSIMRHIHQGIFSILPGVRINDEYSQHLCSIVGTTEILQANPVQLLTERSNLNEDDISRMKTTIELALSSPLEFEVNENHLPREIERDGISLEIDWQVIENENNDTEKLLVTLRDVTEIKKLRGLADKHEKEIAKIAELLAIDAEECQRFFESSKKMLTEVRALLNSGTPCDGAKIRAIFMKYHTMKGHVRSLGFKELANAIHKAEHLCSLYQSNPRSVEIERLRADYDIVASILENYISLFSEKLGRSASNVVNFRKDAILKVLEAFRRLPPSDRLVVSEGEAILHRAYFKSLTAVLWDCSQKAVPLAAELGKLEPKFIIDCPDLDLPPQTVELLQNVFIHLLRNSLDHGLETPDLRMSRNKTPHGCIKILGSIEETVLILSVGDDGQGLNLGRIREKAIEKSIIEGDSQDPLVIANAIFGSGFSTATRTSEISGRGVGMDAVRTMLEEAGGRIDIVFYEAHKVAADSEAAAFYFRIELPGCTWVWNFDQRLLHASS